MKKFIIALFIFPVFLSEFAFSANERIALIIGNSNYTELGTLPNTVNDARNINRSLVDMGYKTRLIINANEATLRKEVKLFAADSDKANIALVFYAGHGAQVTGENYLLPVDINIPKRESDIQLSALKVDDIVNSMKSKTKVVFLDACRDNPVLIKSLSKGRGSYQGGLAPASSSNITDQASGIFIAYSTDAGNIALDGAGQIDSPFTAALLKYIKEPVSIDDMFSMVTKDVRRETKNAQKPYKYASLDGIVCLPGTCSKLSNINPADIRQGAQSSSSIGSTSLPDDWILYNNAANPMSLIYIKPTSVVRSGDRVGYTTKWLDVSGGGSFLSNSKDQNYNLTSVAADCRTYKGNSYQGTIVIDGKVTSDQKWGAFDTVELTTDYSNPSSVAYSAIQLACNSDKMRPLIAADDVESDSWERFYTIQDGVDLYVSKNYIQQSPVSEIITKLKFKSIELAKLKEYINISTSYENVKDTPKVSYLVSKTKFECKEKIAHQTIENYLDSSGKLIAYFGYIDLPIESVLKMPPVVPGTFMDQLSKLACKN